MRPVIFLAFANDESAFLNLLKEESRSLDRILKPLHQKEAIELNIKENASTEDLIYQIDSLGTQPLYIFHYAGHADNDHLVLDDGQADAEGIASLIASRKDELNLVFLNGCSTKGQVEKLLALGVKAVIATSQSIQDDKAVRFAKTFYYALSQNNSLAQSFKRAESLLKSKYKEEAKIYRKIDLSKLKEVQKEESLPWGLYIHPDYEDVLRWKLPQYAPKPISVSENRVARGPNTQFGRILESMQKYDPSINADLKDLDPTDYLNTIIEKLPYPIAVQFQKLVSSDLKKLNRKRLLQISSTYHISSKLVYFFLLSQLWEEKHNQYIDSKLTISDWHKSPLRDTLSFNYTEESIGVYNDLKNNGAKVFLHEYQDFQQEFQKTSFKEACQCLENLKFQVFRLQETKLHEEECAKAEKALSDYLSAVSFLVNYDLYGIRDVFLHKPRYENEVYKHKYALLKLTLKDSISVKDKPLDSSFPTDNNSVILLRKGNTDLEDYLSLSPFVIDKNAFSAKSDSEIFFLSSKLDEQVIFHRVKSSFFKVIEDKDDQIHTNTEDTEDNEDYFHLVQRQVDTFQADFNLS
ncbi:MAG: CHAT domain-containing protein [Bacteroidia bacterium]|nr:CHAT domain-containing protein [Bacteroidia bacterium]